MAAKRSKRPRCYCLYAIAPKGTTMRTANDGINALIADERLPAAIFHDHFLDEAGGIAIFDVSKPEDIDVIESGVAAHLSDWRAELRPLIFSSSPAGLDEQIVYTLRTYRGLDWETLKREKRPNYGSPSREAQTGQEE